MSVETTDEGYPAEVRINALDPVALRIRRRRYISVGAWPGVVGSAELPP
jgi:hypothetical protein